MKELQQIQKLCFPVGICLVLVALVTQTTDKFVLSVALGVSFAFLNFRLLVWSFHRLLSVHAKDEGVSILPPVLFKQIFMLVSLFVFLRVLQIDPIGFGLGCASPLLSVLGYTIFLHQTE